MSAPVEVGFSLGSNIGDKAGTVARALDMLRADVEGLVASSLWRTAPWGPVAQDWFVNACAVGVTRLGPHALLARCKEIERALGRVEAERWGPRVIDVDIVFHGDLALDEPDLVLPHKEALGRAFVLAPLAEIAPDRRLGGVRVRDALALLDAGGVTRL